MTVSRRIVAPDEIDHERLWLLVGACTAVVVWAVARLEGLPPLVCPLKQWTGWPCAGCGTTRALIALSGGALGTAFRLNPLATVSACVSGVWALYALVSVIGGFNRVRIALSDRDWQALRWAAVLALTTQWVLLVADGR